MGKGGEGERGDGALPASVKRGANSSDEESEFTYGCEFHCDAGGGLTATRSVRVNSARRGEWLANGTQGTRASALQLNTTTKLRGHQVVGARNNCR